MAGIVFGIFCVVSVLCAAASGNLDTVGTALFAGAENAVSLMLSLAGAMCLWSGLLEVLREMGCLTAAERILKPLLSRLFPETQRVQQGNPSGLAEITASLSANLLGIGNAATPIGLRAMKILRQYRTDADRMSHAEILFTVLNTAPPTLLPTTLLTLRYAAHSVSPTAILPAVWCVSVLGFIFAAAVTRAFACADQRNRKGGRHP